MNLSERIKIILQENNLKQKELASDIGMSESYISMLLKKPTVNLSHSLAALIEEKYGYNAGWILWLAHIIMANSIINQRNTL